MIYYFYSDKIPQDETHTKNAVPPLSHIITIHYVFVAKKHSELWPCGLTFSAYARFREGDLGNALPQNRRKSLTCRVWTSRQKSGNQRVGCLRTFDHRNRHNVNKGLVQIK